MTVSHPQYLWEPVELYGSNGDGGKVRYALHTNLSISMGQMLYLTEDREASGAVLGTAPLAGIAAEEAIAGQHGGAIAAWTDGVFNGVASAAISAGEAFVGDTKTNNTAVPATVSLVSGAAIGYVGGRALDTIGAGGIGNFRWHL